VHQDGLVHVSQLADRFVKDPHDVVKAGDVVKVRVTEVDIPRKRIGLTMRKDGGAATDKPKSDDRAASTTDRRGAAKAAPAPKSRPASEPSSPGGALGAALLDAMRNKR